MATEKRMTDANALVRKARWMEEPDNDGIPVDILAVSLDAIEDAPTVDAVEVVHGRWIQSEPGYRLCSHCMADVAIYSGHTNYCPNCGAKMDGDGNVDEM